MANAAENAATIQLDKITNCHSLLLHAGEISGTKKEGIQNLTNRLVLLVNEYLRSFGDLPPDYEYLLVYRYEP